MHRRSFVAGVGAVLGAAAFSGAVPKEVAGMNGLSAAEAARRIRDRSLSPVELLEACLRRIDEIEPSVLAWVHVDRAGALDSARALEAEARRGEIRGPLHGVPVGIKDIMAVRGMITTNGSGEFAHEKPGADATCVARLREAGAIILGKTATTQFASGDPAPTRNPWNPLHTPGGSSSGSAAGVAAAMMPLATGTQTGGSVLRPAAYCGIVGLKPTHGRISTAGVTPLAWSLDHVGVFARTVADAALALEVLAGHDDADPFSAAAPALANPTIERPRFGIPRWLYEDKATAEVRDHLEQSASRFEREGATVEEISPPASAKEFRHAHAAIMRVEAAAYHRERYLANESGYRTYIRRIVEEGLSMPAFEYARALRIQREFRRDLTKALHGLDALLLPVAPSTAPKGLDSTGDPVLCVPGSLSGLPAISVPSGLGSQGLPLALQLIGHAFSEGRLLAAGKWCAGILHFQEPSARAERPRAAGEPASGGERASQERARIDGRKPSRVARSAGGGAPAH